MSIGIVITLAVISLPMVAKLRGSREDVVCSSNLRQIGIGILAYTSDNNGVLPGPLNSSQFGYKFIPNVTRQSQLSELLKDYLAVNTKAKKGGRTDVFVCPAFRRAKKNKLDEAPIYRVNVEVPMGDDLVKTAPFGYPNSQYSQLFGTSIDFEPKRLGDLGDIRDEEGKAAQTTTWMIKDVDLEDELMQQYETAYTAALPKTRVHGNHRNAIFFDFHIEKIDWIKR